MTYRKPTSRDEAEQVRERHRAEYARVERELEDARARVRRLEAEYADASRYLGYAEDDANELGASPLGGYRGEAGVPPEVAEAARRSAERMAHGVGARGSRRRY